MRPHSPTSSATSASSSVLSGGLPNVLASAIPSLRWPLDPALSPPMYFEPLQTMKDLRQKASNDVRLPPSHPLVSNLPFTVEELFPLSSNTNNNPSSSSSSSSLLDQRNFGCISIALLLLGNGLTDEAHSIVTPLSWPQDTHFGYGPSIYNSVSPAARSYATYVHCLIHRRENFHVGEFGMLGWANANYWGGAVLQSPGVQDLPHADWLNQVQKLLQQYNENNPANSDPRIAAWAKSHMMDDPQNDYFEPRAVHELCAQVMQDILKSITPNNTSQQEQPPRSKSSLQQFAELVADVEVRVLLAHSLQRAGFSSSCSVEDIMSARGGDESTKTENEASSSSFSTQQERPEL